MSPKLKRLRGRDVVQILQEFGFVIHSSRGSHVKLRRVTSAGFKETLTVPLHDELDVGTVRAIFRQANRYIPEEDLRPYFYHQ